MNSQEKVRVAITNLLNTEKDISSAEDALLDARERWQRMYDELTRVLHSSIGPNRAAQGVVFAGEKWLLKDGFLQREPFTAEVL